MPALERCHVVVLAAGQGTRMGGPKALMPVGGQPWWIRQYAHLGAIGLASTWVVSNEVNGVFSQERCPPPRLVIADSSAPMFTSVLEGLRTLVLLPPEEREGVFILPVDGPVPQRGVWELLARLGEVAAPTFNSKRGHPVFFPWKWVDTMMDNLQRVPRPIDELRLDRLIAPVVVEVTVNDPMVVTNLNTPADVEAFLAQRQSP